MSEALLAILISYCSSGSRNSVVVVTPDRCVRRAITCMVSLEGNTFQQPSSLAMCIGGFVTDKDTIRDDGTCYYNSLRRMDGRGAEKVCPK